MANIDSINYRFQLIFLLSRNYIEYKNSNVEDAIERVRNIQKYCDEIMQFAKDIK